MTRTFLTPAFDDAVADLGGSAAHVGDVVLSQAVIATSAAAETPPRSRFRREIGSLCIPESLGREFNLVRTDCEETAKIAVALLLVGDTLPVCAISNPARALVLVVEDEPEIAALMRDFLEADGFHVRLAADAEEAVAALGVNPACVLLDVMLPGASGFELCRDIRAVSDVPILFLSARDGDADKIRGLGLGADDYIVKSATPAEVVARVTAVLRRSSVGRDPGRLGFGRLEIDLAAHEVLVAGEPVRMTAREFELLRVLVEHPRQVFSREHLFEIVWGSYGDRSAVSVYVSRLREKIESDPSDPRYIVTVWGAGYRFDGHLTQRGATQ